MKDMQAKEVTSKQSVVVAVDSGSTTSGLIVLIDGKIHLAANAVNEEIIPIIRQYLGVQYKLRVIFEDIRPYSLNLTQDVINTCKVIGELQYRLNAARISFEWVTRSETKEWAYSVYNEVIEPLILAKMKKKGKHLKLDGELRLPTFVWIDDAIITAAMRHHWNIPAVRGRGNEYGVSSHSWQALCIGCLFLSGYMPELKEKRKANEIKKAKAKELKKLLKAKNKKTAE